MPVRSWRAAYLLPFLCLAAFFPHSSRAAIVHGTVTNEMGIPVGHANVLLLSKGQAVAVGLSQTDGSYQVTTNVSGRFYVLVHADKFKQIKTLSFYAGSAESHEENIVLEFDGARQEIVSSATGLPVPEAQTSAAVTLERKNAFPNRTDLVDSFRQIPGAFVVRQGEYGGVASLYLRGGAPDTNHVDLDGVPIADLGGGFNWSNLSTAGLSDFELYRGPNSVLFGADASSGSVSLDTPRGSTSFPSFFYEGDAGTFTTFRNQAALGGTYNKLDYYGGFEALQSDNSLKIDEYHDDTAVVNLGYAYSGATQLRVTARNSDAATGTPGPFNFYGIVNAGKRANQDLYLGALLEHSTYGGWHNLVRYGMNRKREQDIVFYANGIQFRDSSNYYGDEVGIVGGNGYSVSGQAILNFPGIYPTTVERVNNRDQVYFQSDYPFTQHIQGLFTFRYADQRGAKKSVADALDQTVDRVNYDYTGQVQGSYRRRLLYSLGGGAEKNQLFGTTGTPRLGLAYYPVLPGNGIFHGTRIRASFAKGYQEPSLDAQFSSLYNFLLEQPGGEQAIQQFHVTPIVEQQSRTYEGGVAQSFLSERGVLRVGYFHTVYGRQIEPVSATEVPVLLPQLSHSQQQALESLISNAGDLGLNSGAFRTQGIESDVGYTLFHMFYLRGGYTYLDAVVRRSFTSDALAPSFNTGLPGGPEPAFANMPIGAFTPLRGARPFQRPPHTGFTSVTYVGQQGLTAGFTAAYASRSDDSTFLAGRDLAEGNSLLLPNRNLDFSYSKLDIGANYQLISFLSVYGQLDNLTANKRIGQIGYPSLPFTFRVGLRLAIGHQKK